MFARLKVELRDAVELVLIPALAIVLPWRWCFGFYRWLTAWCTPLYRSAVDAAFAQASTVALIANPKQWRSQRRLVTLVDHADFFLSCTRGAAWLNQYVDVQGVWPTYPRPALIFTFHWGAGMWALHHAHQSGLHAQMLVNAPQPMQFRGHTLCLHYIRRRIKRIEQLLSRPTIDAMTDGRAVLHALRAGEMLFAVIDVPADGADLASQAQHVSLLGRQASVPRALLRQAVDRALPVFVYLTGVDMKNGQRMLCIHDLGVAQEVDNLAQQLFAHLNLAIAQSPSSWHLWSECPRFFRQVNTDS
jgi:hypothetical protein